MISRFDFVKEQNMREILQKTILVSLRESREGKYEKKLSEHKFRLYIQKMILEAAAAEKVKRNKLPIKELKVYLKKALREAKIADKIPHESTGINVLEDLLKKIIKILEGGYKILTSDPAQRESYRTHVLNAVMNSIAPPRSLKRADLEKLTGFRTNELDDLDFQDSPKGNSGSQLDLEQPGLPAEEGLPSTKESEETLDPEFATLEEIAVSRILKLILNEEIQMNVGQDMDGDGKIDPIAQKIEEPGIIDVEEEGKPVPPEQDQFGVNNEKQDLTGRNIAYNTFQKIENSIIDSYDLLSNDTDRQAFYTYLLVNLMLYFRRFEEELQSTLPEPVVDAYTDATSEGPGISKGTDIAPPTGASELQSGAAAAPQRF